jgi:phospholipid-translocating ATPase
MLVSSATHDPMLSFDSAVCRFLINLTLNHTVRVSKDEHNPASAQGPEGLCYKASSPDEKAFLEAARRFGVVFCGQSEEGFIRISIKGQEYLYESLHVLDFDANRKCMSVIVRDLKDKGRIYLMCKGTVTQNGLQMGIILESAS